MKKLLLFFCFQLLLLFSSCTKDADLKLPNADPMLVISSFISPQDSLVQVAVSLSSPFYNNPAASTTYTSLLEANVVINNGIADCKLIYNSKLDRYVADTSQLKITAGTTYHLYVTSRDGKSASASTTVPFQNASFYHQIVKDPAKTNHYTLQGSWSDPPNTPDYYVFEVRYPSFFLFTGYSSIFGSFTDTIKTWSGKTLYVKDNENEGGVFNRNEPFIYDPAKKDTVFTSLTTISKEYFEYRDKFNLSYPSLSNPFAEPAQLYTNINGGLGIFASFNEKKIRVFP